MKICPVCGRQYGDDTSFCLEDGSPLQNSGSQSAPPQKPQGFVSTSQPAKKGSALPFVLGGGLLVILVVIGLFLALVFFAVRNSDDNQNTVAANNTKTKPAASPQTAKSPDYDNNYNDNRRDNTASDPGNSNNSNSSDAIDFSQTVNYTGTVTNDTAKKSSGVKLGITERDNRYQMEGGLDNKNLFGKFDGVTGAIAPCPKTAPEKSTCIEFNGKLAFGNDGSNFPPGTKAPLTMFLIFPAATPKLAAGAYEIGIIPGYASAGKQKGTFVLTRQ